MERTLELQHDTFVIGADLSALCYAFVHKVPIAFIRPFMPSILEKDKIEKWKHYMFTLSINNLSPFADTLQSIRIADDNNLKLVTKQNFVINIKYNNLIISDDYGVNGLSLTDKKNSYSNLVLDHLELKTTKKIVLEPQYNFRDKFVNKLFTEKKNLTCVSYITDENLYSSDYSEAIVKIKLKRLLKINYTLLDIKREIIPLGKKIYDDLPPNVKILYDPYDKILFETPKEHKYLNYLERILHGREISRKIQCRNNTISRSKKTV